MSFNYPPSERTIRTNQNFYRIRAPLSILFGGTKEVTPENFSIGDLAPVCSPVVAIAVGPDSDPFRYEVIYPDELAPGGINTALLTPVNPLVLPAGVDLSTNYAGTEQRREILIRALDWLPIGGQVALPVVDLIVYTKAPPTVYPTERNPKRFTIPMELVVGDTQARIPISGRQEVALRFRREAIGGAAISWRIEGRKTFPYLGGIPVNSRFELLASTVVPFATPHAFADGLFTYTPQAFGYYDELDIIVNSDTAHDPSSSDTAFNDVVLDVEMRD